MCPIYIIDALRTPVGRLYGSLTKMRPDDLGAFCIKALMQRQKPELMELLGAIVLGCANQAGEDNRNLARMSGLLAELPPHIPAITLNSLCASGIDAVIDAARRIALGEEDLVLAGGVEVMSRSPFVEHRLTKEREDSTIGWRFVNPRFSTLYTPHQMSETAELLAHKYGIPRYQQDQYAYQSRQNYQLALDKKHYEKELLPVDGFLLHDEQHKLLSTEALENLPAIVTGGNNITLANAARIGDGAALLLLASEQVVRQYELKPLAMVKNWATSAVKPDDMGIAPVAACQKIMQQTGINSQQIDQLEISEAFAVQVLACAQLLGIPLEKVNPNGGELSIGKPLGSCGARLLVSLAWAMHQNRDIQHGLAANCAALGVGSAMLLGGA